MFSLISATSWIRKRSATLLPRAVHCSNPPSPQLLKVIAGCIPPLSHDKHKGQAGRVAIVGGCQEYTGAPYYAAISALKTGADLAFVLTTESAATPIKCYSPELMVLPILGKPDTLSKFEEILPRLHSVVVGPGLGRDPQQLSDVEMIIEKIKEQDLPMVIDADGLYLVTHKPSVIQGYSKAILTPNAAEFERLYMKVIGRPINKDEPIMDVNTLSKVMQVTIVRKGANDLVGDFNPQQNFVKVSVVSNQASGRRCGGQGDMLAGCLSVFHHWCYQADSKLLTKGSRELSSAAWTPNAIASSAGLTLTRECNRRAFEKKSRSMLTTDMIEEIGAAFNHLFEDMVPNQLV